MGFFIGILVLLAVAYVAANVLYVLSYAVFWLCRATLRVAGDVVLLPFRLAGALAGGGGGPPAARALPPVLGAPCGNAVCGCANIAGARFCRRCGTRLA